MNGMDNFRSPRESTGVSPTNDNSFWLWPHSTGKYLVIPAQYGFLTSTQFWSKLQHWREEKCTREQRLQTSAETIFLCPDHVLHDNTIDNAIERPNNWAMARACIKIELWPTTFTNLPGTQTLICNKQTRNPTCYKSDLQEVKLLSLVTIQDAEL